MAIKIEKISEVRDKAVPGFRATCDRCQRVLGKDMEGKDYGALNEDVRRACIRMEPIGEDPIPHRVCLDDEVIVMYRPIIGAHEDYPSDN